MTRHRTARTAGHRAHQLALGALLMALGTLFLLDRMALLEAGSLVRYWPLVLVVMGLGRILTPQDAGGGWWILLAGILMFFHTLDILRIGESWPVFVVAAGVGLIAKAVGRATPRTPENPGSGGSQ